MKHLTTNNTMENKTNSSGGLGGGFMLGLLIGVLVTLLLTTKKGREILRDVMDKIIHKLSKIDESFDKIKEEFRAEENSDYIKTDTQSIQDEIKQIIVQASEDLKKPSEPASKTEVKNTSSKNGKEEKPTKRLFFRRTHKN